MRILIIPTYEQPSFILGDSSYLLMNQFVQIASKQPDVFLYWLLPDAATDDGNTGGYLKIIDPHLPTERDKSELHMPACLADFNPIDGKYPVDIVLTNNAGKAAALANYFNLAGAGRVPYPIFVWDYNTKFSGGKELAVVVRENLAAHALGYGLSHNFFFSEHSRQMAHQDTLAFCSASLVKSFLDHSHMIPFAVNSARMDEVLRDVGTRALEGSMRGVNAAGEEYATENPVFVPDADGIARAGGNSIAYDKYAKFTCYFGGRFTATKGGENALEQFDLLYAFGRDVAIKVTTPVANALRLQKFLERRGQEIEVYERLSQSDAWRIMARCHVSIFWQTLRMFPAAPFEQLYAGLVVLFRDYGYERAILPPDYPFVFQTKEGAAAMLRWVYENYDEAKARIAWVPQWIRENVDAVTLVPRMLDVMRAVSSEHAGNSEQPTKKLYELVQTCLYDGVSFSQLIDLIKHEAAQPAMLFGHAKGRPRLPYALIARQLVAPYVDTCETADPVYVREVVSR